jgi:hypothetical protein
MYGKAAIAEAIREQLDALTLDVNDPSTGNPLPAFERIELFDVESLTDAFRLLIISEQRVCIILMLDEQLTTEIQEQKVVTTRMQPVALLISDRRLGDRVKALWGDPADNTIPGAFALEELVLPAVTGQILNSADGKAKVISIPAAINSIFLKDEDKQELPGRAAVMLELHCNGGTLQARIGPGANL